MKVTGYKFQHVLRELAHTRDIAATQFDEGLWVFEGEDKPNPQELMKTYNDTEMKIARLQTAQAEYNLQVMVTVNGEGMSLSEAVKRVGGAGRMEKMWRSVAKNTGRDRFDRYERTRKNDEVRATRTVSVSDAINLAREAAKFASALREAIQVGNATEIDMKLDPSLFE